MPIDRYAADDPFDNHPALQDGGAGAPRGDHGRGPRRGDRLDPARLAGRGTSEHAASTVEADSSEDTGLWTKRATSTGATSPSSPPSLLARPGLAARPRPRVGRRRRASSSRRLASSSGARRIDDGCTVARRERCKLGLEQPPALARDPELRDRGAPEPRSRRGRRVRCGRTTASSASSHGRHAPISLQFGFWWIRRFPRGLPLEVLDHVRHVGRLAVDARLQERLVQEPAGRADERASLEILSVAGLLADEHHRRPARALAEDRLRSRQVQRAGGTALDGLPKGRQRQPVGQEGGGGVETLHALPLPGRATIKPPRSDRPRAASRPAA